MSRQEGLFSRRNTRQITKHLTGAGGVKIAMLGAILLFFAWQLSSLMGFMHRSNKSYQRGRAMPGPCAGDCVTVFLDDLSVISPTMYGITLSPSDLTLESLLLAELLYDPNFAAYTHFKLQPYKPGQQTKATNIAQGTAKSESAARQAALLATPVEELTLEQVSDLPIKGTGYAALPQRTPDSWVFSSNLRVQLLHQMGDPHAVRLQVGAAEASIINLGHSQAGFPVKADQEYVLRLRWRSMKGDITSLSAALSAPPGSDGGNNKDSSPVDLAVAQHTGLSATSWEVLTTVLKPSRNAANAGLIIKFKGPGAIDLDWVSLTLSQPNPNPSGNPIGSPASPALFNPDALAALHELKPMFIRVPVMRLHVEPDAGKQTETTSDVQRPSWLSDLAPAMTRPGYLHPSGPYWVSDGLGVFELMQLSEALASVRHNTQHSTALYNSTPVVLELPIEYQSPDIDWDADLPDEKPDNIKSAAEEFVAATAAVLEKEKAALQLVLEHVEGVLEFLLGSKETRWGKVRESMGRSEPFDLHYVTLTTPNCQQLRYQKWFRTVKEALRERYAGIQLLASCGWEAAESHSMWDVHFGGRLAAGDMPDALPLNLDWHEGPALSIASLAAVRNGSNSLSAAVGEAVVMAAAERNCDMVKMVAHGAMLGMQGAPVTPGETSHLLLGSWGGGYTRTPSFHVQQLFRSHMGTHCAGVRVLRDGRELRQRIDTRNAFGTGQFDVYYESFQGEEANEKAKQWADEADELDEAIRVEYEDAGFEMADMGHGADTMSTMSRVGRGLGPVDPGAKRFLLQDAASKRSINSTQSVAGTIQQSEMDAKDEAIAALSNEHPTIEASATCLGSVCSKVAVKVVNYGTQPKNITVYLWSVKRVFSRARRVQSVDLKLANSIVSSHVAHSLDVGATSGVRKLLARAGAVLGNIVKDSNNAQEQQQDGSRKAGLQKRYQHMGVLTQLSAEGLEQGANGKIDFDTVVPTSRRIRVGEQTQLSLPPSSFTVLTIELAPPVRHPQPSTSHQH